MCSFFSNISYTLRFLVEVHCTLIYSLFYRHNSFCTVFWVSSFYLSLNIVLYQFTVTCIENWSVRSLGHPCSDGKNGSRLRLCFWVVDEVPEKNEWICESRYVSSSKCLLHVFCLILFAIPRLQFMLGLHFTPACVLLSVCSLHFTLSLHFTPGPQSAVRSPQSTFYTDRLFNSINVVCLSRTGTTRHKIQEHALQLLYDPN